MPELFTDQATDMQPVTWQKKCWTGIQKQHAGKVGLGGSQTDDVMTDEELECDSNGQKKGKKMDEERARDREETDID